MRGVDPLSGQIGERVQVGLLDQHLGLEAAHLAGGGGLFCRSPTTDHPVHRRVTAKPISIVHIFVSGKSPEHRLTDLCCQRVAAVPTGPGVSESLPGKFGQVEGIVQFPKREQTGIGGDLIRGTLA